MLHVKLGNTTITFFTFSFHLAVNGDDFVTKFEVFALIARITEMYSIALFPKLWNPLLVSIKWLLIAYVSTQHQHEPNQLLHHCQPCDSLVRNNQHELGVNKWWGSVLNNMDLYNTESRGLFTWTKAFLVYLKYWEITIFNTNTSFQIINLIFLIIEKPYFLMLNLTKVNVFLTLSYFIYHSHWWKWKKTSWDQTFFQWWNTWK